jgi:hypothetical protein
MLASCAKSVFTTKEKVEKAHGLKLPASARNCQQISVGRILDHGVLSLFELDRGDVQQFVGQLKVGARHGPERIGVGDPCVNGWNVWPKNSTTFVPGNEEFAGLKRTWAEEAEPIEMLSCRSPKGDWLHVELWNVGKVALIKLYTDWN